MLSIDILLPAARELEAALPAALARHDTARARLCARPDAARLGGCLDRLANWAAIQDVLAAPAPDVADPEAGPGRDDARTRAIAATVARDDALRYLDAVTSRRAGRAPVAQPATCEVVRDLHRLCHPEGLDTVIVSGAPVRFRPGAWRRWSPATGAAAHGPPPAAVADGMAAWERAFAGPLWRHRHPVVHAALAAVTLAAIAPFPAGNRPVARLVAHGILRRRGAPVCGAWAATPPLEAAAAGRRGAAADPARLARAAAPVAAALAAALDPVPGHLDRLRGHVDRLAAELPAFPAHFTLSRAELARALLARPVDTPAGFAERQGLSRPAAERVLRRWIATGQLRLSRINGRQVIVATAALALLERWPHAAGPGAAAA